MNPTPSNENIFTDLRDRRDLKSQDRSHEIAALMQALEFAPLNTEDFLDDQLPTSGLDCLVHLCRSIFARHPALDQAPETKEDVQANPILQLAWASFDIWSRDETLRGMASYKQLEMLAVKKQEILEHLMQADPAEELTGCELFIDNEIMDKTLWSQPNFKLYAIIRKEPGMYQMWKQEPQPCRLEEGRRSLLRFVSSEDTSLTLQDFIDQSFGLQVFDDGSEEYWMADLPHVVRVFYEPCEEAPANLEQLRRFKMPIYNIEHALYLANSLGKLEKAEPSWTYELGAIIKLNPVPDKRTLIRTYSAGGPYKPMIHKESKLPGNTWRLDGATTNQYILVYHWTDAPRCHKIFPEVESRAGPEPKDPNADWHNDIFTDLLKSLDISETVPASSLDQQLPIKYGTLHDSVMTSRSSNKRISDGMACESVQEDMPDASPEATSVRARDDHITQEATSRSSHDDGKGNESRDGRRQGTERQARSRSPRRHDSNNGRSYRERESRQLDDHPHRYRRADIYRPHSALPPRHEHDGGSENRQAPSHTRAARQRRMNRRRGYNHY